MMMIIMKMMWMNDEFIHQIKCILADGYYYYYYNCHQLFTIAMSYLKTVFKLSSNLLLVKDPFLIISIIFCLKTFHFLVFHLIISTQ